MFTIMHKLVFAILNRQCRYSNFDQDQGPSKYFSHCCICLIWLKTHATLIVNKPEQALNKRGKMKSNLL